MAYDSYPTTRTLRNTPGYTNYVIGVNKNVNGAISSAELKRYYSTIDAEIYFNGEWVEDITNISWFITQNTKPLYGYNSYIFDDVAQGNRIINGNFTLAFTGPNKMEEAIAVANTESTATSSGTTYENIEEFLNDTGANNSIQTARELIKMPVHFNVWSNKFDIDIVCGEKEQLGGDPVHIILKDCYVTSDSTGRVGENGSPAMDTFPFIARDFIYIK